MMGMTISIIVIHDHGWPMVQVAIRVVVVVVVVVQHVLGSCYPPSLLLVDYLNRCVVFVIVRCVLFKGISVAVIVIIVHIVVVVVVVVVINVVVIVVIVSSSTGPFSHRRVTHVHGTITTLFPCGTWFIADTSDKMVVPWFVLDHIWYAEVVDVVNSSCTKPARWPRHLENIQLYRVII